MSISTSTLHSFFRGSDTRFGMFYPTGHLVAVFPNVTQARRAQSALGFSGFLDHDVIAVPGEEAVRFSEDLQNRGMWTLLMNRLSRMFSTDAVFVGLDLTLERAGAAFLAVRCPTGWCKRKAWGILQSFCPIVARHYALDGIEHFKGEL